MSDPLGREEFLVHMAYLREDMSEVKDHLRILNSRTNKAESGIELLREQTADTRKDVAALQVGDGPGKGATVAWSGGVAGAVVGLIEAIRALWK